MGDGRFGPLFRAHDAAGLAVVVRTFAQPLTPGESGRLVQALTTLCQTPLEHPSIARPIACGIEDGRPYLVHSYLPGIPLPEFVHASGHPDLSDIVLRITYVAGALDFAAAAGVLHGSLGARDIIFSADSAGVSGFGLVQALATASIPGFQARREDDIRALTTLTVDLLGDAAERIAPIVAKVMSDDVTLRPATALEFAAQLHQLLVAEPVVEDAAAVEHASVIETVPAIENMLAMEDVPAIEDVPIIKDAPVIEEVRLVDDVPVVRETPIVRETPVVQETPFVQETPAPASLRSEPKFAAPDAAPRFQWEAPAAPAAIDIPLREEAPATPVRPVAAAAMLRSFGEVEPAPARRRGIAHPWWLAAAVAVVAAVIAGFTGGFFVGSTREAPPVQSARAPEPAPVPTPTPAPAQPEAANGQAFTEAPVEEPTAKAPVRSSQTEIEQPVAAAPAPPAARAVAPPRAERRTRETEPVAPRTGPAAVQVFSNPAGAQVFVDGRSVGYAPLVVGELTPGTHSFRMQMPGYRPWVTALTVGPGARERLSASLEQ